MTTPSDFKSSPFAIYGVNGGQTSADTSLATLVGAKFTSTDSRVFTLVQNAGTALAAGVLVQGPASIGANHTGLALATAAATGAQSIIVTAGGTLVTANQYAGGLAVVSAGTNAGLTLKIADHAAAAATAPITLNLEDTLSGNLDVSTSKVTLTLNPYGSANGTDVRTSGVIIAPSGAATGQTIGVTLYPIAASTSTVPSYGWIQTKGPVACLATASATAGLGFMIGDVNGAATTLAVATQGQLGTFIDTPETGKKKLVFINL